MMIPKIKMSFLLEDQTIMNENVLRKDFFYFWVSLQSFLPLPGYCRDYHIGIYIAINISDNCNGSHETLSAINLLVWLKPKPIFVATFISKGISKNDRTWLKAYMSRRAWLISVANRFKSVWSWRRSDLGLTFRSGSYKENDFWNEKSSKWENHRLS